MMKSVLALSAILVASTALPIQASAGDPCRGTPKEECAAMAIRAYKNLGAPPKGVEPTFYVTKGPDDPPGKGCIRKKLEGDEGAGSARWSCPKGAAK